MLEKGAQESFTKLSLPVLPFWQQSHGNSTYPIYPASSPSLMYPLTPKLRRFKDSKAYEAALKKKPMKRATSFRTSCLCRNIVSLCVVVKDLAKAINLVVDESVRSAALWIFTKKNAEEKGMDPNDLKMLPSLQSVPRNYSPIKSFPAFAQLFFHSFIPFFQSRSVFITLKEEADYCKFIDIKRLLV